MDVLRHTSDKAEKYEATIETYKKKLEDLGDLKRQVKILEDKNTMYMQNTMELEEVRVCTMENTENKSLFSISSRLLGSIS